MIDIDTLEEEKVKVRPKKDRKRWCKGKEGIPHSFSNWEKTNTLAYLHRMERICSACGRKEVDIINTKKG